MSAADPVLVEVLRGGVVESVHRGLFALHSGTALRRAAGDVGRRTFVRSAAKPFQAAAIVASGAAEAFHFTDEEIAVIAASHSGEPIHVEIVQRILDKAGIPAGALRCGTHEPLHLDSAAELVRRGKRPSALHNNCSGKHAGMLALAKHLGASLEGYLDPRHPAQARILDLFARIAGVSRDSIHVAIDGCSAPAPAIPLSALARAYAMLANPARLPSEIAKPLHRVATALGDHPRLVAGEGRFDTLLGEATGGRVIAKGGAEGVLGLAVRDLGIGVAFKSADGNWRGVDAPAVEILKELGVLLEPEARRLNRHTHPVLRNHADLEVGAIRVPPGVLRATSPSEIAAEP